MSMAKAVADLSSVARRPVRVRGGSVLRGRVEVQGAKNTALKVLPALAALPGQYLIKRLPTLIDTLTELRILEFLGAKVELRDGEARVDTRSLVSRPVPFEMTKTTTAAFYFAGPLLGRFGEATVGKPGGDDIGARPVDFHVDGLRALGARVNEAAESIQAVLERPPIDKVVTFPSPSAGASVNILLAVLASRGSAQIRGVPRDADTESFIRFLETCGARATWSGQAVTLDATALNQDMRPVTFECPPDRNDAFTWLALAATSSDGIEVAGLDPEDLGPGLGALQRIGAEMVIGGVGARVRCASGGLVLPTGFEVIAGGSPGFHSDWAPFIQLCMTQARGEGRTIDTLHSRRVTQARLLAQMGGDITISGGPPPRDVAVAFAKSLHDAEYIVDVRGPSALHGTTAELTDDVRASAASVLAACLASGESRFSHSGALFRGYEDFAGRLRSLGADIDSI